MQNTLTTRSGFKPSSTFFRKTVRVFREFLCSFFSLKKVKKIPVCQSVCHSLPISLSQFVCCTVCVCLCVCVWVCGSVTMITRNACIDPHQTGFVGKGSDHLQLIKFRPSRAPGNGVCSGAKIFGYALLQPTRSVYFSLSAFFIGDCSNIHIIASTDTYFELPLYALQASKSIFVRHSGDVGLCKLSNVTIRRRCGKSIDIGLSVIDIFTKNYPDQY